MWGHFEPSECSWSPSHRCHIRPGSQPPAAPHSVVVRWGIWGRRRIVVVADVEAAEAAGWARKGIAAATAVAADSRLFSSAVAVAFRAPALPPNSRLLRIPRRRGPPCCECTHGRRPSRHRSLKIEPYEIPTWSHCGRTSRPAMMVSGLGKHRRLGITVVREVARICVVYIPVLLGHTTDASSGNAVSFPHPRPVICS